MSTHSVRGTHIYTHTNAQTHTQTHKHTHTHTHGVRRTHIYTHKRTNTHTHAHTNTHTFGAMIMARLPKLLASRPDRKAAHCIAATCNPGNWAFRN